MPNVATSSQTLVIANGAAISGVFAIAGIRGGTIHFPAAWTAASLGFQVSSTRGGTYLPLYDAAGSLVGLSVVVDTASALPDELINALFAKLWSQTAGSGVNQGAARSLIVDLAS